MQRLVQGVHKFQSEVFGSRRELFERLAAAQKPEALFITCSDSRVDPTLVTQSEPGTLFELQNAGNMVPPYGAQLGGSSAATVEYAVSVLKVRDVIVCGHSHCGAMTALLQPREALDNVPAVQSWLRHAETTRRIVQENYAHLACTPERHVMATVEENVLVQLENLRTHPSVAAALARGELNLHAWVYKFETGEVFAYDAQSEQFVPLAEASQTPSSDSARLRLHARGGRPGGPRSVASAGA
ncbi:MAG: carbonic anhydrase [Planctomycetes bacterium]|nr:carbonic anhydrase [Planctomycetota bacterium]